MEKRLIDANYIKQCVMNIKKTDNIDEILCNLVKVVIDQGPTVFTIPENPTNGDIIKIIFPSIALYEKNHDAIEISFKGCWWNAPYMEAEHE